MASARDLDDAVRVVGAGGVIVYPTEGCFGLGCDPRNTGAVIRLLRVKGRSWKQGLILVGHHWSQLKPFVDVGYPEAIHRARATWPGPYTWLLPARRGLSRWLRGSHDSIAVRVTSHPVASELCRRWGGALVSTSANLHGQPPAMDESAARQLKSRNVDYVLRGRIGDLAGPTEIRDALANRVVRRSSGYAKIWSESP